MLPVLSTSLLRLTKRHFSSKAESFGYDAVLQKVVNIVKSVAENMPQRILHVHCGGKLASQFGEV